MPYEVSMYGGQPWGFRLAGGSFDGTSCTISRITPGGKAAQANVMQGDVLMAVNGISISDLSLPEIMQRIKSSGEQVHLTLLSQEEVAASLASRRQSELNITTASEMERPSSNLMVNNPRFIIKIMRREEEPSHKSKNLRDPKASDQNEQRNSNHTKKGLTKIRNPKNANKKAKFCSISGIDTDDSTSTPQSCHTPVTPKDPEEKPLHPQIAKCKVESPAFISPPSEDTASANTPTPKPRSSRPSSGQKEGEFKEPESETKVEERRVPDYVKRHLKPQRPMPEFKPQVNWLHGKLKINLKPNPNAMNDPGNKLKTAAQAHPNQRIEIDGPLSATVVHAQYNTPVGLYSGSQIVNTLVGTAAAKGAKVPDPEVFGANNVDVNTQTPVYKLIHHKGSSSPAPAQSRSIQILDALLAQPGADIPTGFN